MGIFRVFLLALIVLSSCSAYKRDIMFRLQDGGGELTTVLEEVEENYLLRVNDEFRLDVFTNDGELLLDPQFEMLQSVNPQVAQFKDRFRYIVQADSTARLPKLGSVKLVGLTIQQAEELLQEKYNEFFVGSFVKMALLNRRVTVLGAVAGQSGNTGGGVVVPLDNENMKLTEVLALSGGVVQGAKVASIRLIRGDLAQPEIYEIDLSTVEGLKRSQMAVLNGDVIYIEPWRRPFVDAFRDYAPIFSVVTSVATLVIVIQNSNRN